MSFTLSEREQTILGYWDGYSDVDEIEADIKAKMSQAEICYKWTVTPSVLARLFPTKYRLREPMLDPDDVDAKIMACLSNKYLTNTLKASEIAEQTGVPLWAVRERLIALKVLGKVDFRLEKYRAAHQAGLKRANLWHKIGGATREERPADFDKPTEAEAEETRQEQISWLKKHILEDWQRGGYGLTAQRVHRVLPIPAEKARVYLDEMVEQGTMRVYPCPRKYHHSDGTPPNLYRTPWAPYREPLISDADEVLLALHETPASVPDLAERLGWRLPSVRSIVSDLEALGTITATTAKGQGRGRPSKVYALAYPDVTIARINAEIERQEWEAQLGPFSVAYPKAKERCSPAQELAWELLKVQPRTEPQLAAELGLPLARVLAEIDRFVNAGMFGADDSADSPLYVDASEPTLFEVYQERIS